MVRLMAVMLAAIALFFSPVTQNAAAAAAQIVRAKLHGSGLKGNVQYQLKKKEGKTFEQFRVKASKGLPLKTYGVYVNGKIVGTLTTNAQGKGEFELRSAKFIKKGTNCKPIPESFPTLGTGDIVSVGPACGIMFRCGGNKTQTFEVRGEAEDEAGVEVDVKYREKSKLETLRRTFKVEIEDAAPAQSFDVLVNGASVGVIVADAEGEAEFKLDSKLNDMSASACDDDNDDDDGEIKLPMPSTFPSLQPGDIVQVGTTSVTLSLQSDDDNNCDDDDDDSDDDEDDDDDDDDD